MKVRGVEGAILGRHVHYRAPSGTRPVHVQGRLELALVDFGEQPLKGRLGHALARVDQGADLLVALLLVRVECLLELHLLVQRLDCRHPAAPRHTSPNAAPRAGRHALYCARPPFPTVAPTRVPTVHSLPPSLSIPWRLPAAGSGGAAARRRRRGGRAGRTWPRRAGRSCPA